MVVDQGEGKNERGLTVERLIASELRDFAKHHSERAKDLLDSAADAIERLQLSERTSYERGLKDMKIAVKKVVHAELALWSGDKQTVSSSNIQSGNAACFGILDGIDDLPHTVSSPPSVPSVCQWQASENYAGFYNTGCKEMHGGTSHGKFCTYCGKPISIKGE